MLAGTLEEVVRRRCACDFVLRCVSGGGAVAQLGERLVRNEEVSGSIPLSSTIRINDFPHQTREQSNNNYQQRNNKGTLSGVLSLDEN